jgi:hypothetical protein
MHSDHWTTEAIIPQNQQQLKKKPAATALNTVIASAHIQTT